MTMTTTHGDKDPNPRNKYNLTPETARVGYKYGKLHLGRYRAPWSRFFRQYFLYFPKLASQSSCNTLDVIYLICIPTLAVSGLSYFIFPRVRVLSPCVVVVVMHLISCALHLHTCSSHAFEHFPCCPFAFRRFVLLRWSFLPFFRVWGLNISGLDRDFPCGLGLIPVDRLSSFVPFGLRLILQRLTEGPRRPRVCCIPTPFQFGPKPTKTLSII